LKLRCCDNIAPYKMCKICNCLIYDMLISPLSVDHLLRHSIYMPSLLRCAHDITDHLYRAMKDFPLTTDFFIRTLGKFDPSKSTFDIPDEYDNDEFIWLRFYERYPEEAKELDLAVQCCLDAGVARDSYGQEDIVKHFLMHKFRSILSSLPAIHNDHIKKAPPLHSPSLGSVPTWRINQIRQKAGLPLVYKTPELDNQITIQVHA